MGAGSITSNVKSDKKLITIKNGEKHLETGIKKQEQKTIRNKMLKIKTKKELCFIINTSN